MVGFDFAPQPVNMHVQPVFMGILHRPNAVEQKFGGDDAAGVADENIKQLGFGGSERDEFAIHQGFPFGKVDHEPLINTGGRVEGVAVAANAA